MLKNRVIPVLLIEDDGLVKTTKFKDPKYLGDPVNTVKIFNTKEVDEIFILDILASKKNYGPNFTLVSEIASEAFMPLCYGGGIRNFNDAERLFSSGVEKISIQTSAFKDLKLIQEISNNYGSQAVVVSIDVKRDLFGRIKIYNNSYKGNWMNFAKDAVNAGAGEIFINSVNQDGTLNGPDLELITKLNNDIDLDFHVKAKPMIGIGRYNAKYCPVGTVTYSFKRVEDFEMIKEMFVRVVNKVSGERLQKGLVGYDSSQLVWSLKNLKDYNKYVI